MRKQLIIVCVLLGLLVATHISAGAVSLVVDKQPATVDIALKDGITYVPLRAVTEILCPEAIVSWENQQAVIRKADLLLLARPNNLYIEANGRMLLAANGVKLESGTTMIPIRVLAKALGASVVWDGARGIVAVESGTGTIQAGDSYYDSDEVYWLSQIISAESSAEPLRGKVAVGNVILNRVVSPDFPNSIYGVIFDSRWGGQFEPVKNGAIYNAATAESILAAKLCLDGALVVGGSLFFLNPSSSSNLWTMQNRSYITTIGNHLFYV